MEFFWLALGIAIAGYCIGDGLKNFKNADAKPLLDSLDNEEDHELIQEKDIHYFIGIAKEDATSLVKDHPDVPHIVINKKVYFQKGKLKEWLTKLGE
ncbi:DNA-binding protein [Ornithinibacillus halotolerans]|uniref:DNA-binding protein n=1 Tax=Ornithinibacillus halotolerans TaxID=1274357 RepID=A0A916WD08_9BACI|nr:DNA-binding protein [Ornithinibacillus halotolerans]GGA86924.1 hypothetical protein GCM10008025_32270 [Ornithinibacillus halotolerans]